ncbi:MAG: D-alanine--D-alanine ligase [Myxococcales bacterium]|nr:D-alanine--D-alanine ligase [Myxococcales bacterium]
MDQSRRIGVLIGGRSPEREISLRSGEAIVAVLREQGHDAVPIYVDHDLDLGLRQERIEVAFIALHGRGADGPVQGLLESLGIPYTGSSLAAAALAADKLKSKELLRLHNLPTPAYYCHSRGLGEPVDQHGSFGFPCVVKPRAGGSGVGVSLAHDVDELESAVETALRFDDDVLIERHAGGREVQVAILEGQVLGVAEVVPERGVLDYAARYTSGRMQMIAPPRLGAERLRGVVTLALRAHHLFGCDGATRVDLMVSERGNETLLEVEPFPELTGSSLVPRLAQISGLSFADLVERILEGARLHAGRRMRERRTDSIGWGGLDRRAVGTADSH